MQVRLKEREREREFINMLVFVGTLSVETRAHERERERFNLQACTYIFYNIILIVLKCVTFMNFSILASCYQCWMYPLLLMVKQYVRVDNYCN